MCCINFYALHFKTEMGNSLIAIFCNSFIRIILQLRNMFNYENNSKKIFMSLYNCLKNCLNLQKTYTHKKEFVKEIFFSLSMSQENLQLPLCDLVVALYYIQLQVLGKTSQKLKFLTFLPLYINQENFFQDVKYEISFFLFLYFLFYV